MRTELIRLIARPLCVTAGLLASTHLASQQPEPRPAPPVEQTDAGTTDSEPVPASDLLAPSLAAGIVRLEFDRMVGTAFPTPQFRGGKRYDLQSIYLAGAGVVLVVDEDQTTIPPLAPTLLGSAGLRQEYITDAELDALAGVHRSLPVQPVSVECVPPGVGICTEYHVYGVVVDHLYWGPKGKEPGVLGVMWDTSNRSQFAMFYRNKIVRGDGGRYLRSVAHEIGHAFNLHHPDGDGRSSIITQTKHVGEDYTYEFSAAERAHLREHTPQKCSRPGAGSFSSVDAAHGQHSGMTVNCM